MSVRFDSLLCRTLAAELGVTLGHRPLGRLHLDRERGAAILAPRSGPALVLLLHPTAGYILQRDQAAPLPVSVNLKGLRIGRCLATPDERCIVIELGSGAGAKRLVLELQTNQLNAILVQASDTIEAILSPRRRGGRMLRQGVEYPAPRSDRKFADVSPTREQWLATTTPIENASADARRAFLLREIAWTSTINIEHLVGGRDGADAGVEWADAAFRRYVALRDAALHTPSRAYLLRRAWGAQPYVAGLDELDATPVESLLDAFEAAFDEWRHSTDAGSRHAEIVRLGAVPDPEATALLAVLESRMERLDGRLRSLRRELERGPSSEELRSIGHLLLARISQIPRGVRWVTLGDFDGTDRRIELDPRREPAANAAAYYERAARRARAEDTLPARIAELEAEVHVIGEAIERTRETGPSDGAWTLAGGRPRGAEGTIRGAEAPRLPYRRLFTTGGLELRIGRGARDNDELTFRHSVPDDIWLHARQSPGAHVVLRWGRRDANPPQRDLVEAAIVAALNSDARHSKTVAVDWTRRKYVRKPRKAPPGSVLPDRVTTLFVEPDESLLTRLRELERPD